MMQNSIASASVVMSGHMMTDDDMLRPAVKTTILLDKEIIDFLREEGLDKNIIVNKLLRNFMVAYKAFWKTMTPGLGLEPRSPKRAPALKAGAVPLCNPGISTEFLFSLLSGNCVFMKVLVTNCSFDSAKLAMVGKKDEGCESHDPFLFHHFELFFVDVKQF